MTKAAKLLKKYGYNPTPILLDILKECMEAGFDAGVKMSHISKDDLLKQWFEDDIKKVAKERAKNYMLLP